MTATPYSDHVYPASFWVAAEIRGHIARAGLNQSAIAAKLGVPGAWLSRRIGAGAAVAMTLEEIDRIAEAIGVEPLSLLVEALGQREDVVRACRDSNPKPSDLVLGRTCQVCGWPLDDDGLCADCDYFERSLAPVLRLFGPTRPTGIPCQATPDAESGVAA